MMNVKESQETIRDIETDIQSINVFLERKCESEFYKKTFERTVKHLELYKRRV